MEGREKKTLFVQGKGEEQSKKQGEFQRSGEKERAVLEERVQEKVQDSLGGDEEVRSDLIFGVHPVRALLVEAAGEIEEVIVLEHGQRAIQQIAKEAAEAGILLRYRPRSFFDRLLPDSNHQGVIARKRSFAFSSLDELLALPAEGAILMIVGVQDAGNLGAILRSARAFGVKAVILHERETATINDRVIKASAGAALGLSVIKIRKSFETIQALKEAGWWVLGLAPCKVSLHAFDLCRPALFLLGAEGEGLKPSLQKHCDALLGIEMQGGWDSLNVSVSAGIALYEWQRQQSVALKKGGMEKR
jgi:23S rRNA (guanosine2251-2'-O)-methyltransferase